MGVILTKTLIGRGLYPQDRVTVTQDAVIETVRQTSGDMSRTRTETLEGGLVVTVVER